MTSHKPRNQSRPPASGPGPRQTSRWLVGAAALVAVVAVAFLWPRGDAFLLEPNADQNVLLVTIDTLRADALSSYGGPAQTPNLDRLAAQGARFTFAHAHAVVTLPSHTSILTGRFPYEHGMRDNSGFRVKDGTPTLATRLKPRGFATGAFVGGFPLTKRFGLDARVRRVRRSDAGDAGAIEIRCRSGAPTSSPGAVDWIGKTDRQVLRLGPRVRPALALQAAGRICRRLCRQPYYGEVAYVDHVLGPLFTRLAQLSRPTLVIVTADHGESLGEHGELTHGMFAYEATLRVPLIVARVTPAAAATRGVVVESPARHIDIVPTVLDAVGVAPDAHADRGVTARRDADGAWSDRPAVLRVHDLQPGARVGAAARRAAGEEQVHRSADPRAVRPRGRRRRGAEPRRGPARPTPAGHDQPAPHLQRGAAEPAGQESAASGGSPAFAGLRQRQRAGERRLHRGGRSQAARPGRSRPAHRVGAVPRLARPEAIAMLQSVIARRPDTADAYLSLAYAYWEAGQPQPAIAVLEKALASGAPDRDVRIRLGVYLAESHTDPARAITLLEGMSAEDVEALNGLGVAYGDAGRHADATATFKKILTLDATNGFATPEPRRDCAAAGAGVEERRRAARAAAGSRVARAPGDRRGSGAARCLHDARRAALDHRPQERRDRQLEARGGSRRPPVQRALQPHRPPARSSPDGRGPGICEAVRLDGAAGALRAGDRPAAAISVGKVSLLIHGEETRGAQGDPVRSTRAGGSRRQSRLRPCHRWIRDGDRARGRRVVVAALAGFRD